MSSRPSLHAYQRPIDSPFGLLGTDENALTFALGYTFQQCLPLLQWFLKKLKVKGVYRPSLRRARIDLQRSATDQGITDIEIRLPGHFHVIVEAKIGLSVPSATQCGKYLARLRDANEPIQRLVAVVQSPDQTFVGRYSQDDRELSAKLVYFSWPALLPECIRLMTSRSLPAEEIEWIRCFYNFLSQEFRMKAYTTEVWILAVNTKELWPGGMSHWDIHQKYRVWWDYRQPSVRPLYMAFRADSVLDCIHRVSSVEHEVPIIERVPELRKVKEHWVKSPATIWHFERPVKLSRSLKTGGGMYNRRVRCDLDLLLSCDSVQEIENRMSRRRQQPDG